MSQPRKPLHRPGRIGRSLPVVGPRAPRRERETGEAALVVLNTNKLPSHKSAAVVEKVRKLFLRTALTPTELSDVVSAEVTRQLNVRGVAVAAVDVDDAVLRPVRAYAEGVFGATDKAERWLHRPSVTLAGARPVDWLRDHPDDMAAVYRALDAIAYGAPV